MSLSSCPAKAKIVPGAGKAIDAPATEAVMPSVIYCRRYQRGRRSYIERRRPERNFIEGPDSSHFRDGSVGGMVILLAWLYLSVLMVLLGAVINAQSEQQTREDSTEGPPRALGQRDARAADTLGASTG